MPRRLLAALVLLFSVLAARVAGAADSAEPDAKPPSIDLYTLGAGDYLAARFGHSALCVRPAGANVEDATATCYDYGVPVRDDFVHMSVTAVRGEPGFVPVVVGEKVLRAFFEGQGRSVERQQIPLMPDEAARLAKRLEDDVERKVAYAYHPYWSNCTTYLRDHLDAATNGRLRPGPFTPAPGTFRELSEEGLSGRLGELTLMALLLGNADNGRVPTPWESMYLPVNLRDGVRDRLGAPIEKLTERQAVILPTSRAIGRVAVFALAIVLSLFVRFASRRGRTRAAISVVGATLGTLGVVVAGAAAFIVWPEVRHNWALLLLVPTDLALPWLARRRSLLVAYARARIGVALLVGILELAGVIAQPMLPLVALVFFPFSAVLRAIRAEAEAKSAVARKTDADPAPAVIGPGG